MSSLAFALDPSGALLCGAVPARPVNSVALTRRAANRLPGRARAARRLVRRRVLQLLRSGARRVCSTPEARRLFVGLSPCALPTARRPPRTGCQTETADAATPGPRVHCSLFNNWPRSRSRHCARAFVQRKRQAQYMHALSQRKRKHAHIERRRGKQEKLRLVTCASNAVRGALLPPHPSPNPAAAAAAAAAAAGGPSPPVARALALEAVPKLARPLRGRGRHRCGGGGGGHGHRHGGRGGGGGGRVCGHVERGCDDCDGDLVAVRLVDGGA